MTRTAIRRFALPLMCVLACHAVAACSILVDTSGFATGPRADVGAPDSGEGLPDEDGGNGDGGGAPDTAVRSEQSCIIRGPGTSTCGALGSENCCESPLVSGGSFLQSYDGVTFNVNTHPATLSTFRMDRFEVTVGRFRAFLGARVAGWAPAVGAGVHTHLNAGRGLTLGISGSYEPGWNGAWSNEDILPTAKAAWSARLTDATACPATTWTDTPGAGETLPITCTTWYEAYAFCIWDGGFLPSFAEWNYAAAGGLEQRVYPWSPTTRDSSITCMNADYAGDPPTGCEGGSLSIAPAGSRSPSGDGRWRHADLAGNVAEWSFDQFDAPLPQSCTDCATFSGAAAQDTVRAAHGGAFSSRHEFVYASSALAQKPGARSSTTGVRCARP